MIKNPLQYGENTGRVLITVGGLGVFEVSRGVDGRGLRIEAGEGGRIFTRPRGFWEDNKKTARLVKDIWPELKNGEAEGRVELVQRAFEVKAEEILGLFGGGEKTTPTDGDIPLGDGVRVRLTQKGVDLIFTRMQGERIVESETKVIMGAFQPVKRMELDGEEVFEVVTGRRFRGNAEEVQGQLRKEGLIVNKAKASDAINALFQGLDLPREKGHATYGVYLEEGKLVLCLDPLPRTESHEHIIRQIGNKMKIELTKANIEPWFDVLKFWHGYEIFPLLGASVMAPFGLELRGCNIMVPYIFHKSPESGLGKSEVARVFTKDLYGVEPLSADAIKSEYRLMDAIDSAGLPITITEAEAVPWEKFSAHFQTAAEQKQQDRRGTSGLGSRIYWARAVLVFTGNHFPTKKKALLVRFIDVEFDRAALKERMEKRGELRGVVRKLEPIGVGIVREELENLGGDLSELVRRINEHGDAIEKIYPGFEDPRRPQLWGLVYEGLKAWELAAIKTGAAWRAPNYSDFVKDVVERVEGLAFESVEAPAARFISWWRGWKASHAVMVEGVTEFKENGATWREDCVGGVDGVSVTSTILGYYEKEAQLLGMLPINSLTDLARGISSLHKIPYGDIYADRKFGGVALKSTFIPLGEKNPQQQTLDEKKKLKDKILDRLKLRGGVRGDVFEEMEATGATRQNAIIAVNELIKEGLIDEKAGGWLTSVI